MDDREVLKRLKEINYDMAWASDAYTDTQRCYQMAHQKVRDFIKDLEGDANTVKIDSIYARDTPLLTDAERANLHVRLDEIIDFVDSFKSNLEFRSMSLAVGNGNGGTRWKIRKEDINENLGAEYDEREWRWCREM